MRSLVVAVLVIAVLVPAAAANQPQKVAATPAPAPSVPNLYVRGQILTVSKGILFFTSGDGVRIDPTLLAPHDATLGRTVRVAFDQNTQTAVAIEVGPGTRLPDEVDVANLPRQYIVVDPGSARPIGGSEAGSAVAQPNVSVTIVVQVPANTPLGDEVYLATERSNYSPAEIRMTRVDARRWTASLSLPAGTTLHYQFSRGYYATIERQRNGDIVVPHALGIADGAKSSDTVARWADVS